MSIEQYVKKLQALPDGKKKAIIVTVVVVVGLVLGFFWVRSVAISISHAGQSLQSLNIADKVAIPQDAVDSLSDMKQEIADSTNKMNDALQVADWEEKLKVEFENNIENWSLYQPVSEAAEKKFGNDTCDGSMKGDPDFINYEKKAEIGPVYKLELSYNTTFYYTPNYNTWTTEKLLSFTEIDRKICSLAWPIPVHAYPDKVLWAGANINSWTEVGEPGDKSEFMASLLKDYFSNKK